MSVTSVLALLITAIALCMFGIAPLAAAEDRANPTATTSSSSDSCCKPDKV